MTDGEKQPQATTINGMRLAEDALEAEGLTIHAVSKRCTFAERRAGLAAFSEVLKPIYGDPLMSEKIQTLAPHQAIMLARGAISLEFAAVSTAAGAVMSGGLWYGLEWLARKALPTGSLFTTPTPGWFKAIALTGFSLYDGAAPSLVHAGVCAMGMGDDRVAPAVRAIFKESAPESTLPDDARRLTLRIASMTGAAMGEAEAASFGDGSSTFT